MQPARLKAPAVTPYSCVQGICTFFVRVLHGHHSRWTPRWSRRVPRAFICFLHVCSTRWRHTLHVRHMDQVHQIRTPTPACTQGRALPILFAPNTGLGGLGVRSLVGLLMHPCSCATHWHVYTHMLGKGPVKRSHVRTPGRCIAQAGCGPCLVRTLGTVQGVLPTTRAVRATPSLS